MLDIINDLPKRHQKDLLLGYKTLLQSSIEAVSRRLGTLDVGLILVLHKDIAISHLNQYQIRFIYKWNNSLF
jgi:hypothetical protein